MLRTIGQIAFNSSYHDTILIKFTNKYRYAEPVDKPNDMKYSYIKVKVSDVNYIFCSFVVRGCILNGACA